MTTLKKPPSVDVGLGDGKKKTSIEKRTGMIALILVVVAGVSLGLVLSATSPESDRADATVLTQQEVTDRLMRNVGGDIEYEVLYTPTWYFEWSSRPVPDTGDTAAVGFLVFETVHVGLLPDLPEYTATSNGEILDPFRVAVVDSSDHHRVTQVLFDAENGPALMVEDGDRLELTIASDTTTQYGWNLDHTFGAGVLGASAAEIGITSGSLTMPALFAIFGGMLTALSPCLLLLATYYTAVLAGTATQGGKEDREAAMRKMITTSLWFIGGFTLIYTGGGAIAGYVGSSIGRLDNIGSWARPISIVAGIIVILLGIRVAAQSNVPMVCKMPGFNRPDKTGAVGSAMMGSSFAVGCLSCFSATVLSALLLYAGATGSPFTGALIMLTFSATVGLIFLLAAFLVAKAVPLVSWVDKARPWVGGFSAVVMIALGILMVTYTFHRFTGWIFEVWS